MAPREIRQSRYIIGILFKHNHYSHQGYHKMKVFYNIIIFFKLLLLLLLIQIIIYLSIFNFFVRELHFKDATQILQISMLMILPVEQCVRSHTGCMNNIRNLILCVDAISQF